MNRIRALRHTAGLSVLAGLLLPAALIGAFLEYRVYAERLATQTQELLVHSSDALATHIQDPLWKADKKAGQAVLDLMMTEIPEITRIEVRDSSAALVLTARRADGRVVAASTNKAVVRLGVQIGDVKIELGADLQRRLMGQAAAVYFLALCVQIGLALGLTLFFLDKRLLRPLQKMGDGLEQLSRRQLDVPFACAKSDEFSSLGRQLEGARISLFQMVSELTQRNRTLEREIDRCQYIEQELHEREARYRALVEQSPIAIIEWDPDDYVVEWNAAAEHIFGYTRKRALGRHASFIMLSTGTTEDAAVSGAQPSTSPCPRPSSRTTYARRIISCVRTDGQIITCQWSNTLIADRNGHADRLLSMAEDVSEKTRIEEAKSLSEAKFAGAFQCNPDSVSITRASDNVILEVNQTFETMTGFTKMEAVGKTALELGLWLYPTEQHKLHENLRMGRMVRDFCWSLRTKHADTRVCQTNGTVFTIGKEVYLLTVDRDITDQRLMEEQKAEADRALLRLAQGTQDMIGESFFTLLIADLASALRLDLAFIGLIATDDPGRIKTIAVHRDGTSGENFNFALSGSPAEHIARDGTALFTTDIHQRFQTSRLLAEREWESFGGISLRNSAGAMIGILAVMHSEALANPDLVKSLLQVFGERASAELERKRSEEALRHSEQRFSTIFHSSPVAMSVFQLAEGSRVVDLNNAFERSFLLKRNQVVGKNDADLGLYVHDAERRMVNKTIRQNGHIDRYEAWINRGDGSKGLFMLSGSTFELGGEKFVIFSGEDITEKYEIENEILDLNATLEERVVERTEELQQANQELESTLDTLSMAQEELVRSEKLAALGSLVAGIAHELNTPLGNSLMVASTLIDRTRGLSQSLSSGLKRSTLESYIRDASKAGEILERNLYRAAGLVSSFKRVAVDQTSSQRRSFSLAEIISEIMLALSPTMKHTAFTVEQNIPEQLIMDSYPGPLEQVVNNLVNNALLHGFDGRTTGTVSIAAEPAADGWVELTVRDDGVGVPPANHNRIFDPFFTTKLGAGGSGLGLPITHNIVTSVLGGRLRMQSEVGVGTTFVISLPLVAPQARSEDEPGQDVANRSFFG